MLYNLLFFSSKCSLLHNDNLFGSRVIQILYTGCAKLKKNNSGAKGLTLFRINDLAPDLISCRKMNSGTEETIQGNGGHFDRRRNMPLQYLFYLKILY